MKQRDTIEFDLPQTGAAGMACAVIKLNQLCNDGRCWVVSSVFDHVRCTAFSSARIPLDYVQKDFLGSHYWRDGKWHSISQKRVDAAEERSWEQSFTCDR